MPIEPRETLEMDEDQASAGTRSTLLPLLHLWQSSSDAATAPFHVHLSTRGRERREFPYRVVAKLFDASRWRILYETASPPPRTPMAVEPCRERSRMRESR